MTNPAPTLAAPSLRRLALLSIASMAAPQVFAQVVDTNRPGFSATPGIVATGHWQLETGVGRDRPDSGSRILWAPLAEARFGVADGVELFVGPVSWADTASNGSSASGLVDAAVGAKVALSDAGAGTRLAVLFQLSVPIGDTDFTTDRWDPAAALVWAHDGGIPLAGTVRLGHDANGYRLDNGLKLPFVIGGPHSAFLEWQASLPEGGDDEHWLNGGYQWLTEDTLQLDAGAGIGLNDRAGDYRLGLGFSVLF